MDRRSFIAALHGGFGAAFLLQNAEAEETPSVPDAIYKEAVSSRPQPQPDKLPQGWFHFSIRSVVPDLLDLDVTMGLEGMTPMELANEMWRYVGTLTSHYRPSDLLSIVRLDFRYWNEPRDNARSLMYYGRPKDYSSSRPCLFGQFTVEAMKHGNSDLITIITTPSYVIRQCEGPTEF